MIGIIDYGVGNIKAFANIFRTFGIKYKIVSDYSDILSSDKIILPGVGSFDSVMEKIHSSGLLIALNEFALDLKKPILGVCVGMQILSNYSEEGKSKGLGWIPGKVVKFEFDKINKLCTPQIGWNDVIPLEKDTLFANFQDNPKFYFLHSYYYVPENNNHILANSNYGKEFVSAVRNHNIFGTQFHPEKSHQYGIKLLQNFSKL